MTNWLQKFRQQQTKFGGPVTPDDKQALQNKLKVLENELNHYLAEEYGVDSKQESCLPKLATLRISLSTGSLSFTEFSRAVDLM